jgi:sulfoxide reductase heme-binding subunit YedZ
MNDHSWWLVSRAAGVVALLMIAAAVLMGLALAAGFGGPPARRRVLVVLHEHTAVTGMAAAGLHGVALLGDAWLKPSLTDLAIPFAGDYRPFFTGLGIVAGYLGLLLGVSFYTRRRIGAKRWRKLHRATPVVYVLALVHALGAGSDAGTPWLRALLLATALPAAGLLLARVARRTPRPARAPPRATGA